MGGFYSKRYFYKGGIGMTQSLKRFASAVLALVMAMTCLVFSNVASVSAADDASDCVAMGSYEWNSTALGGTAKTGTYNNMTYSLRKVDSSYVQLRSENTIKFKVAQDCTLTATFSNNGLFINGTALTSDKAYSLKADTEYTLTGDSGNTNLTKLVFATNSTETTTETTTATETSTEATTATTTTKADDTTETTTTAPADKAFAVSGDSWSAENDSVPTWLNGGKLTTATNSSSYKAFAAESANGTAFTKTVNVAADSSITIDVADALTASVFIAGNNNAANKGVIKATFTDESGTVTDITPADANLGGRKTATTAFELVATGKGTITVTPDYNSLLYKVTVK